MSLPIRSFLDKRPQIPSVDIATLRGRYGLTQAELASLLGIALITVKKWEQGTRNPDTLACVVLHLLDVNPEGLLEEMYRIR